MIFWFNIFAALLALLVFVAISLILISAFNDDIHRRVFKGSSAAPTLALTAVLAIIVISLLIVFLSLNGVSAGGIASILASLGVAPIVSAFSSFIRSKSRK